MPFVRKIEEAGDETEGHGLAHNPAEDAETEGNVVKGTPAPAVDEDDAEGNMAATSKH